MILPCFPSFREFFVTSEETASSSDPLLVYNRSNDHDDDESSRNSNGNGNDNGNNSRPQQSRTLRLVGKITTTATTTTAAQRRRKQSAAFVILKLDAISGALQLPHYKQFSRDTCPLLRHCWSHRWEKVVDLCTVEPHRALHITEHSRRTALHLAIFNRRCPLDVAQALLTANRHMILVQDANRYTPLHLLAFFSTNKPPQLVPEHQHYHDQGIEEEDDDQKELVQLFCDTAVMVEQELQNETLIPPACGTSPIFLAAKRNGPLSMLKMLLNTRKRTNWIAPSTGGEPYWDCQTLDEYSSPLEVLLRDSNRSVTYMNPDYVRNNPKLRETLRRIAYMRLSDRQSSSCCCNTISAATSTGTMEQDRCVMRKSKLRSDCEYDDTDHQNESLYKDGRDTSNLMSEQVQQQHQQRQMEEATIDLWEKCVELLAGYCPLLQVGDDVSHIPYGVLHAVTSCKVPIPSLVQFVMVLFPEQNLQRDEQGMIPLHHVLRHNHKYATGSLLDILLLQGGCQGQCGPPVKSTALIPFPNYGPMPLSYALLNHLPVDSVIDKLLSAESDISLHTMDPSSGLFPFCLAALPIMLINGPTGGSDGSLHSLHDRISSLNKGATNEDDLFPARKGTNEDYLLFPARTAEEISLANLNMTFRLLQAHPQVLNQLLHVK
jgi:ankyrin repeat protein